MAKKIKKVKVPEKKPTPDFYFEVYSSPEKIPFKLDLVNRYRWRLVSKNGRIVADSGESYHNRQFLLNMIHKFTDYFGFMIRTNRSIEIRNLD